MHITLCVLQRKLDTAQPQEKADFSSGFSTTDQIQTTGESRTKEQNVPLVLRFIDFENLANIYKVLIYRKALPNSTLEEESVKETQNRRNFSHRY